VPSVSQRSERVVMLLAGITREFIREMLLMPLTIVVDADEVFNCSRVVGFIVNSAVVEGRCASAATGHKVEGNRVDAHGLRGTSGVEQESCNHRIRTVVRKRGCESIGTELKSHARTYSLCTGHRSHKKHGSDNRSNQDFVNFHINHNYFDNTGYRTAPIGVSAWQPYV